jgi:hypothetical protein
MRVEYEYNLVKPDGSPKQGCNKITYNDDDVEIMKEYLPDGIPKGTALQAVLNATPEELQQIKQLLGIS